MGTRTGLTLALLFVINTMNFFDRQILGAVAEPIRKEWGLNDSQMGMLGTAFILLYAVVGVPLGRWADHGPRTKILAGGVFVWSLLTAASGLARNYGELFLARLGVGVGEASCAPSATALIGDLFPARHRGRALSVFMLGLPLGIALSFLVSGAIAHNPRYGWRSAFFIAGIPGVICAALALFLPEPPRGGTEQHSVGSARREGSPYWLVLSIPTMWWMIASGALHNFNMYALGAFLAPLLQRYHGVDIREAGLIAMTTYGLSGIPGLVLGGILADSLARRYGSGRLLVGAIALAISAPMVYLALRQPAGETRAFVAFLSIGCGAMYVYYSSVYATVQDVVEPALRGTAMALYFFAMYVLGAALGPYATGAISDYATSVVAGQAGVVSMDPTALEPYRAAGLHKAMHVLPVLNGVLSLVLLAGAFTVGRDSRRLRDWMQTQQDNATAPTPH